MHRTEGTGYVVEGGKRRAVNWDEGLGVPGTVDTAEPFNAVQEEICNTIELEGGTVADTAANDRAAEWRQLHDTIFLNGNIRELSIQSITKGKLRGGICPPHAAYQDLCRGFGAQWDNPLLAENYFSTASEEFYDTCLGYDFATKTPMLFVLLETGAIHSCKACYDYESAISLETELSLNYDYTPDTISSICSDGDYLYVCYHVDSGNSYVSKYDMNTFTGNSLWTRDLGVYGSSSNQRSIKLKFVTAQRIAMVLPGASVASQKRIGILTTSNSAFSVGEGNYQAGQGDFSLVTYLATDGIHVFWIQYTISGSDRNFFVLSAKITNPTTSDYSRFFIKGCVTLEPWTFPRDLICTNNCVVSCSADSLISLVPLDGSIGWFDPGYMLPEDWADEDEQDCVLGFDGQNLWMYGVKKDYLAPPDRYAIMLSKAPMSIFSERMSVGVGSVRKTISQYPSVIISQEPSSVSHGPVAKFLFDGQDLWLAMREGKLYRITAPGNK